ncbi:MAG: hypothetical protein IPL78_15840 [Chloroflexi bacterium]|nr:hypothetical protein [Chloroflexota bacterium]
MSACSVGLNGNMEEPNRLPSVQTSEKTSAAASGDLRLTIDTGNSSG